MKAFFMMFLLVIIVFFIASSSLANVDLTPDTPSSTSIQQQAAPPQPDVIMIQEPLPEANTAPTSAPTPATSQPQIPVTGSCSDPYTVQPGDMLSLIAEFCNTTVGAIRLANPQITNINLIYPGQQLRIPGAPAGQQPVPVTGDPSAPEIQSYKDQVVPIPDTGGLALVQAGSSIQVQAFNYPANVPVNILVGPQNGPGTLVLTGTTDSSGSLTTSIVIPQTTDTQTPWVVTVSTTTQPVVQAASDPFYVTP